MMFRAGEAFSRSHLVSFWRTDKKAVKRRFRPTLLGISGSLELESRFLPDSIFFDITKPYGISQASTWDSITPTPTGSYPVISNSDTHGGTGGGSATASVSGVYQHTTVYNGYNQTILDSVTTTASSLASSTVGAPATTPGSSVQAVTFVNSMQTNNSITADNHGPFTLATYPIQADAGVGTSTDYNFAIKNASGTLTTGQTVHVAFSIDLHITTGSGDQTKFFRNASMSLISTHLIVYLGVGRPTTDASGALVSGLLIKDPSTSPPTTIYSNPSFGFGNSYTVSLTDPAAPLESVRFTSDLNTGPTGTFNNETDSTSSFFSWSFSLTTDA